MKSLTIFLFAILFFTGCNNNKGWSIADRQKGLKMCVDEIQGKLDDNTAKKYCSCVLEKAMSKYPSFEAANNNTTTEEGTKMGQACAKELKLATNEGGGDDAMEENGGKKKGGGLFGGVNDEKETGNENENGNTNNILDDGGNTGGGWSSADKRKYMNECTPSAVNTGVDQQTANKYCDCTLKKMQKRYKSYNDAQNNMTNEVMTAIQQECAQMPQNDGDN